MTKSNDDAISGCLVVLVLLAVKALAIYGLYHWILQPITGLSYELGYWESMLIALLVSFIF